MGQDLDDRRGVLRTPADGTGSLERRPPSARLAPYVAWYWSVRWDRTGRPPHRQVTLPHVSAHLVVEDGTARLYGVQLRRFERVLAGAGRVVAVRFTAGGLAALLGRPLVGGPLPASALPGLDVAALVPAVSGAAGLAEAAGVFESMLEPLTPVDPDPAMGLAERAVQLVRDDVSIRSVGDLASRLDLGIRTLQRLFARQVGVTPGWVIRRCRLQEAALRATEGGGVDWAGLAVDLGYSDQAHLVREFTSTFGVPPGRYAREGGGGHVAASRPVSES